MSINSDVQYWMARVAELERELDAAPRLSMVKVIAGELMRAKAALKEAKAKSQSRSASLRPKRGTRRQSGRHSASNAAEPASA
jgi:hypothetical protein